jgi:hypothetical protein
VSACGVCGVPRRRGSGGRVFVLGPDPGQIRSVIACGSCARRSVAIAIAPLSSENVRKGVKLEADERNIRFVLRGLARHLRGIAKAMRNVLPPEGSKETHFVPSRISDERHADGLEQAADIANAWAENHAARQVRK